MTETHELVIDSIAGGGDGVGRLDGMVTFVPRTSPGDRVRVDVQREGRLNRGRVVEMLEPSAQRTTPSCKHYDGDGCGGCQLQHLPYESQLSAKSTIVRDALNRIGGLALDAAAVEPSPTQWRYRAKLTLALRRSGGAWIAGMHAYDAPRRVFSLEDCHITDSVVLGHWREVMAQSRLFPDATELRASVRKMEQGFAFVVEGGTEWGTHFELFTAVPAMRELWWQASGKSRRRMHSRGEHHAGASFTQVNPAVAAKLRQWVCAIAAESRAKTAVDAFSGSGDIAVDLAALGLRVTAIEIDRDASALCAARLPVGSRAVAASVESALPRALPTDFVVLNPPRAGLAASIPAMLQAENREPRALVYVSCDAATLARDLRRLTAFRVESVRAFDMFPQTAHVETVCHLVPTA
jgi:23S rRNA (uracil1939-C5)-methyltransferase